jgi:hypothetical protein
MAQSLDLRLPSTSFLSFMTTSCSSSTILTKRLDSLYPLCGLWELKLPSVHSQGVRNALAEELKHQRLSIFSDWLGFISISSMVLMVLSSSTM